MTSLRSHVIVDAAPDSVWKVVSDTATIADWFPAMRSSTGDSTRRTVVLQDGSTLDEVVVNADPDLRRAICPRELPGRTQSDQQQVQIDIPSSPCIESRARSGSP